MEKASYSQLVKEVKAYATEHYSDGWGWDSIIKNYGETEIENILRASFCLSLEDALKALQPYVGKTPEKSKVELHRSYYVDRIVPAMGTIPEHGETIREFSTESKMLEWIGNGFADYTNCAYRLTRCDRIMRDIPERAMKEEEYRITYVLCENRKVWRFLNHYEGLNKLPR